MNGTITLIWREGYTKELGLFSALQGDFHNRKRPIAYKLYLNQLSDVLSKVEYMRFRAWISKVNNLIRPIDD